MPRADRLLALLDLLRRHRGPVSGAHLAGELGVSLRSLYRDIQSLRERGAEIEGEAGFGYVLKPGFLLPPLMFSREEIEALVLGSRFVVSRGDPGLAQSAARALAKIRAVLPPDLVIEAETSGLVVPPAGLPPAAFDLGALREAIRRERKVTIAYEDAKSRSSQRTLWPFAIGYFNHVHMMAAWCETREDFRHFRIDRIVRLEVEDQRYPRRRAVLLKEWREREGIAPQ